MKEEFVCKECGNEEKAEAGKTPSCCGKQMKRMRLKACTASPSSAEHARPMEDEEPCDDSRGLR